MVYILIRFQFELFIHSILSWFKERIIRVKDLNTNIEILYIIDIHIYIYLRGSVGADLIFGICCVLNYVKLLF